MHRGGLCGFLPRSLLLLPPRLAAWALRGGAARTSFRGRPRQDFDTRAWRSPVRTGVKIPSDPRKCSRAAPPLRAPSRNECAVSSRRDGPTCEREDFRRCGMAAGRLVHLGGRMRKQKPETRLTASGPCRRDRRNPDREQRRTARRRWRVSWWQHDSRMAAAAAQQAAHDYGIICDSSGRNFQGRQENPTWNSTN